MNYDAFAGMCPGKETMSRNKSNSDSSALYRDLYSRSIYDAYYLAQGLLGGEVRSMAAVEQAYRRVKEKLEPLTEAEQDNILLQQVAEICREQADTATLEEESGADYIAFMSMPLRSRQVLVLADALHLPDAIIAQIMHSRKDRVVRALKEARADLAERAASALDRHDTTEQILERNVRPLTAEKVEALWMRLGGKSGEMADWQEPDMRSTGRKIWPLVTALVVSVLVLMGLVTLMASGYSLRSEDTPQNLEGALQLTTVAPALTRTPSTLTTTPVSEEPTEAVVLTLGGDTVLGGLPSRVDRRDSFPKKTGNESTYPFAGLLPVLSRDDLTILNLECTLTERNTPVEGQEYPFKGRPDAANMLVAGSVEMVSLENSHSMDYGESGYADMKSALETAGVQWVDAANCITYDTKAGVRIGVAALKDPVTSENLADVIDELKKKEADFIVLSLHWGEELAEAPSQEQQTLAHEAIDLGADVIMGHHSHVVQPMEVYNKRPIFYSLGNAVYGGSTNPSDWDIALARLTLACRDGEVVDLDWMAIPGCVSGDEDDNDYQPQVYEPGTAEAVRVYSKLGMSHTQLAGWKKLYDELYPKIEETSVPSATAAAND